ncbi:MAG: hypothetical protein ACP5L4_06735 [Thermoplasmata archaeon]
MFDVEIDNLSKIYRKVRSLREAVKLRYSEKRYTYFPQQKIFLIN